MRDGILVLDKQGDLMAAYGNSRPESKDGKLDDASFFDPLGGALSSDEKIRYISEIKTGKLRSIVFELRTVTEQI